MAAAGQCATSCRSEDLAPGAGGGGWIFCSHRQSRRAASDTVMVFQLYSCCSRKTRTF
uniref:OSJNBa0042N22.5 protein n=1 Tax=Oryza sativa subsp. japonica TaxID=39947 RepID=Q7XPD4_ORYSJ|nr:OSJNBa0042N22.5 [Oryza sativa Japonica Group]